MAIPACGGDQQTARRLFFDRAHQPIHQLASATSEVDRAASAKLLEAKRVVEDDLDDPGAAGLADHPDTNIAFIHLEVWQGFKTNTINPAAAEWINPPGTTDAANPGASSSARTAASPTGSTTSPAKTSSKPPSTGSHDEYHTCHG